MLEGINLLQITFLALVDSINPCTLAVQIMLLSALLITRGRRGVLMGGTLFAFTVYLMYLLYGVGILKIIYALGLDTLFNYALAILLVILISLEFLAYFKYKPGLRSIEMPLKIRPYVKKLLSSAKNPLMAVPLAVFCSVALIPCSSGPYAATLLIIRKLIFLQQIIILFYYNLLFILPMLLITFIVYFGVKPEKIMEWREKHIRELHLIAGFLLLGVLVLLYILPYFKTYSFSSTPTYNITSLNSNQTYLYCKLPNGFILGNKYAIDNLISLCEKNMCLPFKELGKEKINKSYIYIVYSPSCPHCEHLLNYVSSKKTNVVFVKTTNGKVAYDILKRFNITWDFGVPLTFAYYNNSIVAISGYPSKSQDNNGYFLSEEKEKEICISLGGKLVYK